MATQLGIDHASRVLVINTEGATAPSVYRELVGISADQVIALQEAYHG
jgi:diaminopropionate ammonia-lyase